MAKMKAKRRPAPAGLNETHFRSPAKVVNIAGKRYYRYRSFVSRGNALKEIKILRGRGIPARNFQVRRGNIVVDNVIYTRPQIKIHKTTNKK